jgi:hypothetical protein
MAASFENVQQVGHAHKTGAEMEAVFADQVHQPQGGDRTLLWGEWDSRPASAGRRGLSGWDRREGSG